MCHGLLRSPFHQQDDDDKVETMVSISCGLLSDPAVSMSKLHTSRSSLMLSIHLLRRQTVSYYQIEMFWVLLSELSVAGNVCTGKKIPKCAMTGLVEGFVRCRPQWLKCKTRGTSRFGLCQWLCALS